MKKDILTAIASLFAYAKSTDYGFNLNNCTVFDYDPAEAETLFQKLQPFFSFQSDRFAPPRLDIIGWGCYERYEGRPYGGKNTLCFNRDYLPTPEEVEAYAALYSISDLDAAYQGLATHKSWEIYLRFPQEESFYSFCEHLVPYCDNP